MRALDLFCGAGGASAGMAAAGFEVTGVDNVPQPHYPFAFVLGDALTVDLAGYDLIWASPPCQRHSSATKHLVRHEYADLVSATRARLMATGGPYIIENVPGAPLIDPVMLCGRMFGLRVLRHRMFETSRPLVAPVHEKHPPGLLTGRRSPKGSRKYRAANFPYVSVAGCDFDAGAASAAMGIDWMHTRRELAQAIPPAYAEYMVTALLGAG